MAFAASDTGGFVQFFKQTELTLPAIAHAFNRRDHTTVLHAIRRVERSALEDASVSRTLEELTSQLRSGPAHSGPDGS